MPEQTYRWWELVRDLWRWLRPYRGRFLLATFLRGTTDLIWLYPAFALAELVTFLTSYQFGESLGPAWLLLGLWVVGSVYHYIGRQIAKYLAYSTGEQVALDIQVVSLRHLFAIDLAWHERENSGNKIKRIQRAGTSIDELFRAWIDHILEAVINFVGVIVILATFDRAISSLMLLFVLVYYGLSIWLTRGPAAAAHRVNVSEEALSGLAFESISNVRSVKVLGMSEALMRRVLALVRDLVAKIKHRIKLFRTRDFTLTVLGQIFRLGLIGFIVLGIAHGRFEVGLLVLIYDYFFRVWRSIDDLSEQTQRFVIAQYSIGRMVDILREPIQIDRTDGKRDFPTAWQGLAIKDLTFGYGDRPVLQRIGLEIRRGERIGIVGQSGAGKSTLFKLLLKEYEDYVGEILIDDVPVRDIDRRAFTAQTAVVLQDTEVFNFSLRDNVTLTNQAEADNEALLDRALKVAHVTDFLNRLPDGIDTVIGEKGVRLSGGEKQRVGIARAVFKQPEILFLDEATSHLDSESEAKIADSLHQVFRSVTAIVIAHRLSTIKEMDRIYVLEQGTIVESGSFAQLRRKKGRFHQMWEQQRF